MIEKRNTKSSKFCLLNSKFYLRGLTLIEVLVMVTILALMGVVATGIFFTVLRTSTRTNTETKVKQKGQFALSVMEKMIRGARSIENASSFCDDTEQTAITIGSYDGGTTEFLCGEDQISSNSAILVSGLTVDCSQFVRCVFGENAVPKVIVNFTLSTGTATSLPFQKSTENFQTTVSLRNY